MADLKITELTGYTLATGTDLLPIVDITTSITKKITVSNLLIPVVLLDGRAGGQTLIGGLAVTDILKLQGTSGNGTAASAAIQLLVGNNGGTIGLTMLNNGNVGIGTTGPGDNLDISAAFPVQRLTSTNTVNGASLRFYENSTLRGGLTVLGSAHATAERRNDLEVWTSGGDVTFSTNSGGSFPLVLKATSGNVGIGTTGPGAKLDVDSGNILMDENYYLGTATYLNLKFTNNEPYLHSYANIYMNLDSNNNGTTGAFRVTKDGLDTAGTELFRVEESGNVGIGTTGPGSKLHILSNSAGAITPLAGTLLTVEDNTSAYIGILGPTATHTSGLYFGSAGVSTNDAGIFYDNNINGTRKLRLRNSAADRLTIDNDGNVGIGTTSPVGVLDIVTVATNDDPTYSVRQARIATTDAIQTTLQTIAIAVSKTYLIEARVVARRTGGTAGTADDGAVYIVKGTYTTKSSTVTLLGSLTVDHSAEDVAGYDATLTISGTNVLVSVTGVADTNIVWHVTSMVSMVGT